MNKHLALLGLTVRDKVTGYSGVVTSVCFDLYGCVQAAVTPSIDKSKPEIESIGGHWFDEKRLVVTESTPVMEPPTFDVILGPSSKPAFPKSPLG